VARVAYLDCFSGVSGDMLLGAVIDAGIPVEELRAELKRLPLEGYELTAGRVKRAGIAATHARVEVRGEPAPRTLADVLGVIDASSLPAGDRDPGREGRARGRRPCPRQPGRRLHPGC